MKTAALIRDQVENSLSARIPVALSPRTRLRPEKTACGLAAIDEILHGGLSAGTLTEFVGRESSGRTSIALACLAAITQVGHVGAWIDVDDTFSPETAAANGVDLERLLWVRCGAQPTAPPETVQSVPQASKAIISRMAPRGGGSPHPRSENRNMPEAIQAVLMAHGGLYDRQVRHEKRKAGTPGAAAPSLSYRSEEREEQVSFDRLHPRRGENLDLTPRSAEPQPRYHALEHRLPTGASAKGSSWQALDQALRATDLLLHGGGFSAMVLDLGSVPAEMAWRIPLATWFRFRAACERNHASLVLLTQHPCARSSAELVVRLEPGSMEAQSRVMTGIRYRATPERSRSYEGEGRVVPMRKPPQSERPGQWTSEAAWAQGR